MAVSAYVIRRAVDGYYVTAPGLKHSYTAKLQEARVYRTKSLAEDDCCGNEQVVSFDECFHNARNR